MTVTEMCRPVNVSVTVIEFVCCCFVVVSLHAFTVNSQDKIREERNPVFSELDFGGS